MFHTPSKSRRATRVPGDYVNSSPDSDTSPETYPHTLTKPKKVVPIKHSPPSNKARQIDFSPATSAAINKTYASRVPSPEVTEYVEDDDELGHKYNREARQKRLYEAREHLQSFNLNIESSRNLKTEIKGGTKVAIRRIYTLLCQCDSELGMALREAAKNAQKAGKDPVPRRQTSCREVQTEEQEKTEPVRDVSEEMKRIKKMEESQAQMVRRMEEQTELLKQSLDSMNNLSKVIQEQKTDFSEGSSPKPSYASVAAARRGDKPPTYRTLHSVAITSKDTTNSADDTLRDIRKALNAKEGGVEVERVRKSRDGRVIISCGSAEERDRLTRKLLKDKKDLTAENITNKKPMVMITGVLRIHTDEDLFRALKNQNKQVFEGLEKVDEGMEIAYKMRSRNPNTHRVVLKVTPPIWKRLTEVGTVRIDLQTLQVTDRSPLTQCTICLGFGHGKKLCTESQVMCSHCGGPHTMSECEEHIVGAQPKCKNCVREKKAETGHNAFSERCPVRAKWDAIVRATVAYE